MKSLGILDILDILHHPIVITYIEIHIFYTFVEDVIRPLGMESLDILDSQIVASSYYMNSSSDTYHKPQGARINFVQDLNYRQAWRPQDTDPDGQAWIQVNLYFFIYLFILLTPKGRPIQGC